MRLFSLFSLPTSEPFLFDKGRFEIGAKAFAKPDPAPARPLLIAFRPDCTIEPVQWAGDVCMRVHVQTRVRFSRGRACFAPFGPPVRKARGFGCGSETSSACVCVLFRVCVVPVMKVKILHTSSDQ